MDLGPVARHAAVDRTSGDAHAAAVLLPVVERADGDYLLFTKRADHLGEHPGQMSFPGGGREPEDDSLAGTALREANEEIGLEPQEAELVGRLDDIVTVTRYAVRPYVARVVDRTYHPDEREVAEVVVLPVSAFLDPANFEYERRDHPHEGTVTIPYFHVADYTVWGATGRILSQFLELVADWSPPA